MAGNERHDRNSRRAVRNERGRVFTFDADDLPLVFGVLRRGELVKYRHELRRRGITA
jgi:hypothetical protein